MKLVTWNNKNTAYVEVSAGKYLWIQFVTFSVSSRGRAPVFATSCLIQPMRSRVFDKVKISPRATLSRIFLLTIVVIFHGDYAKLLEDSVLRKKKDLFFWLWSRRVKQTEMIDGSGKVMNWSVKFRRAADNENLKSVLTMQIAKMQKADSLYLNNFRIT